MRRRLINFMWAVSLIVCVSACVLWVRSWYVSDGFLAGPKTTPARCWWMADGASARGKLVIQYQRQMAGPSGMIHGWSPRGWNYSSGNPYSCYIAPTTLGFAFAWRRTAGAGGDDVQLRAVIPTIFLFALGGLSALLLWSWKHRRQRLLAARGAVCESCGYDLRATPDRCPECGMVPPAYRSPHPPWGESEHAEYDTNLVCAES